MTWNKIFIKKIFQSYTEYEDLYPDVLYARLAGESNPLLVEYEGRIELSTLKDFSSDFGLVCDIGWGINEANVACRHLGFRFVTSRFRIDLMTSSSFFRRGAFRALHGNYFHRTRTQFKLSGVKCRGDENSLAQCVHNGWNNASSCPMDHEAGVICCKYFWFFKNVNFHKKFEVPIR